MRFLLASALLVIGLGPAGVGSACQPVVIDTGGTYDGCYRSTDPDVPAVLITTTDAVRITGATIEHTGEGVVADVDRMRLTVVDSTFTALDPGLPEPVPQRAVSGATAIPPRATAASSSSSSTSSSSMVILVGTAPRTTSAGRASRTTSTCTALVGGRSRARCASGTT